MARGMSRGTGHDAGHGSVSAGHALGIGKGGSGLSRGGACNGMAHSASRMCDDWPFDDTACCDGKRWRPAFAKKCSLHRTSHREPAVRSRAKGRSASQQLPLAPGRPPSSAGRTTSDSVLATSSAATSAQSAVESPRAPRLGGRLRSGGPGAATAQARRLGLATAARRSGGRRSASVGGGGAASWRWRSRLGDRCLGRGDSTPKGVLDRFRPWGPPFDGSGSCNSKTHSFVAVGPTCQNIVQHSSKIVQKESTRVG